MGTLLDERPVIERLTSLPDDVDALVAAAVAEDWGHLSHLVQDWESGRNRFDASHEGLFGARTPGGRLVGICGVNQDPYGGDGALRLRRMYVLPSHRRRGVARALLQVIEAQAVQNEHRLVLRTHDEAAAAFYEAHGYTRWTGDPTRTHAKEPEALRGVGGQ